MYSFKATVKEAKRSGVPLLKRGEAKRSCSIAESREAGPVCFSGAKRSCSIAKSRDAGPVHLTGQSEAEFQINGIAAIF